MALAELRALEDAFSDVDPDDVEVSTSDGVLRLELRDGTRIVINSHRAARQIWMAAIASAWHFDPTAEGTWRALKIGEELRPTPARLISALRPPRRRGAQQPAPAPGSTRPRPHLMPRF